jgi:hypothetical protein
MFVNLISIANKKQNKTKTWKPITLENTKEVFYSQYTKEQCLRKVKTCLIYSVIVRKFCS